MTPNKKILKKLKYLVDKPSINYEHQYEWVSKLTQKEYEECVDLINEEIGHGEPYHLLIDASFYHIEIEYQKIKNSKKLFDKAKNGKRKNK